MRRATSQGTHRAPSGASLRHRTRSRQAYHEPKTAPSSEAGHPACAKSLRDDGSPSSPATDHARRRRQAPAQLRRAPQAGRRASGPGNPSPRQPVSTASAAPRATTASAWPPAAAAPCSPAPDTQRHADCASSPVRKARAQAHGACHPIQQPYRSASRSLRNGNVEARSACTEYAPIKQPC